MATARFLVKQKPQGTAYVIGEGGLLHALHRNGYSIIEEDPDYVAVGEGRATDCKAFSVGKPSPVMLCDVRNELGLTTAETTITGDMMETDIPGGVQMGYHTVLTLTGGTRKHELPRYAFQPGEANDSVAELCHSPLLESRHAA